MVFEIKWRYPIERNEYETFTQACELNLENTTGRAKVNMPSDYAGVYISNLINACNVDEIIKGYWDSRAYAIWSKIAGREYIEQNHMDGNENYILYDSMAFPAFCIVKNIQTALSELDKCLTNRGNIILSDCSYEILGQDIIKMLNNRELTLENMQNYEWQVQDGIDNYVEKYNRLLMSAQRAKDDRFYSDLCDCLKTYDNGKRRLIKQYLKQKGGRCFATFIRQCDGWKFIAFSGFNDVDNKRILTWLKKTKSERFVAVAKSICHTMKAVFVPTNLETRRYHVKSPLPFYIEQGLSIDDLINLNYNANDYKEHYSCCERKIFGNFSDQTPDGTLYVKMKVCSECGLGLIYQWGAGGKVILKDGLKC